MDNRKSCIIIIGSAFVGKTTQCNLLKKLLNIDNVYGEDDYEDSIRDTSDCVVIDNGLFKEVVNNISKNEWIKGWNPSENRLANFLSTISHDRQTVIVSLEALDMENTIDRFKIFNKIVKSEREIDWEKESKNKKIITNIKYTLDIYLSKHINIMYGNSISATEVHVKIVESLRRFGAI